MFKRTYYATHPDMMNDVSNDDLRDRYLIHDLFRDEERVLIYTHADRFVIGAGDALAAALARGACSRAEAVETFVSIIGGVVQTA